MIKRFLGLLRVYGLMKTLSVLCGDGRRPLFAVVLTGGMESGLADISSFPIQALTPSKLRNATSYGPVNGWALRQLLRELDLSKLLHFADLGLRPRTGPVSLQQSMGVEK